MFIFTFMSHIIVRDIYYKQSQFDCMFSWVPGNRPQLFPMNVMYLILESKYGPSI
jgi:hypothetical protein